MSNFGHHVVNALKDGVFPAIIIYTLLESQLLSVEWIARMVNPVSNDFFSDFKPDSCTLCGECFHSCPIMELPREEAIQEMKTLVSGKDTKTVLKECQSCFSCNMYCPENANPASLILQRWNEQYKRDGLKIRGRYYVTFYPQYPNFRTHVVERMPESAKAMVNQWADTSPLKTDTLTYPGCNVITYPELTRSKMFEGMDIRGRLEYHWLQLVLLIH